MDDHKEKAIELLGKAGWGAHDDPGTAAMAHATLYLAEQQRIANLIAYWQLHTPRTIDEGHTGVQIEVRDIYSNADESADRIVREGLDLA